LKFIDSFIHKLAGALALMSMINITGTFTSTRVRAHPDARLDVARARPSRPSLGVSCDGEGRPGDAMVRMKVTMKRARDDGPAPEGARLLRAERFRANDRERRRAPDEARLSH